MQVASRRLGAVAVSVAVGIAGGSIGPAGATVSRDDRDRARHASGFLTLQQNDDGSFPGFSPIGATSEGVVAFVAVRRGRDTIDDALAYLASHADEVDKLGEIANVVPALTAGGADPRDFEGRDLVAEINATLQEDGRYASPAEDNSGVYDHALSMLALAAAGETIDDRARSWLVAAQCDNGGWQFDHAADAEDNARCHDGEGDFTKTDTNTTALAIQALEIAPGSEAPPVSPFRFLKKIRDPVKGGWGYTHGFRLTDANSTSLVIRAYAAAGKDVPDRAQRALKKLQFKLCSSRHGAFAYSWEDENEDGRYTQRERGEPDVGATIAAIPGLLEAPAPVAEAEVTRRSPICDTIE